MEYQNSPEFCPKEQIVTTSDRFYELLGVPPGASRQELKAAYRDLTKVWHPDRFAHDPRLQQKAEEKLKEINEAYEHLISGKSWLRKTTPAPRSSSRDEGEQRNSSPPVVRAKSRSLIWRLAPLIVFGCVFAFTIRFLHARVYRPSQTQLEESAAERDHSGNSGDVTTPVAEHGNLQSDRRGNEAPSTSRQTVEQQRLSTTTVVIDSATGLLARDECPTKVKMTYPTGSEPHAYCNAHPAKQQSKLKSLQKNADSPTEQTEKKPEEPYHF